MWSLVLGSEDEGVGRKANKRMGEFGVSSLKVRMRALVEKQISEWVNVESRLCK